MKIQHRRMYALKDGVREGVRHRTQAASSSRVQHRPSPALKRGEHRHVEDVPAMPGSTPPQIDHRPAPPSAAKIGHAKAAEDDRRGIQHKPANLPVVESLDRSPKGEPTQSAEPAEQPETDPAPVSDADPDAASDEVA